MGSQNINREIKAGDKVKINLEVVAETDCMKTMSRKSNLSILKRIRTKYSPWLAQSTKRKNRINWITLL